MISPRSFSSCSGSTPKRAAISVLVAPRWLASHGTIANRRLRPASASMRGLMSRSAVGDRPEPVGDRVAGLGWRENLGVVEEAEHEAAQAGDVDHAELDHDRPVLGALDRGASPDLAGQLRRVLRVDTDAHRHGAARAV